MKLHILAVCITTIITIIIIIVIFIVIIIIIIIIIFISSNIKSQNLNKTFKTRTPKTQIDTTLVTAF